MTNQMALLHCMKMSDQNKRCTVTIDIRACYSGRAGSMTDFWRGFFGFLQTLYTNYRTVR